MGIGSMINSFLNPQDAYKAAERQAQQGWQEAQGYERPYWQQGLDQYGNLTGAENALLDPAALESKWAQSYQTSPYAKQLLAQNKASGLDAASAMGLMGSSAALGNIQSGAGNIVNEDRQQFLQDLMQKYLAGIGIGQNIYGTGAMAGNALASGAQREGEDLAGLKYGEKAAPGSFFGKLLGTAADLGLNYATGGLSGMTKGMNNMMSGAYTG